MDKLNSNNIKTLLGDSIFSDHIIIYDSLESTNNTAKELYEQGAESGTVILSEKQTIRI